MSTVPPDGLTWLVSTSSTSRDLPTPPSPSTTANTARPWHWAMPMVSASSERSNCRPTKGTGVRRRRRPGSVSGSMASHAATLSSRPLTSTSPTDSNAMAPTVAACVAGPTSTPPGGAAVCSRDAVLTTSPMAV